MRIPTLCALTIVICQSALRAQEWTRFRGPNGTGISAATTVPVQFSEGDFNWKVDLPGVGHSCPVLWGKKIFITGADEAAGKRFMVCLNAKDGSKLWTKTESFTHYSHHEFNTCASSTPAADKDHAYFLWGTPDSVVMEALDHDGNPVWKRELGKLGIQHGIGTSPVVIGDVVILGVYQEEQGLDGFLIGLDRRTGGILWKRSRNQNASAAYATPLVYAPKGGAEEAIFASTAHGITSLNPKTGEVNWEVPNVVGVRCVASPILANGLIIATAGQGDGVKQTVAVRPASKTGKAELAYKLPRGLAYVPTPIAWGDRVYFFGDGGIVTCIKPESGETVWQERLDGRFFGSPVCVNGRLYAMSVKGDLFVLQTGDQFKQLAMIPLGEASHATPTVADGVMYLRTQSHLISVGGKR